MGVINRIKKWWFKRKIERIIKREDNHIKNTRDAREALWTDEDYVISGELLGRLLDRRKK